MTSAAHRCELCRCEVYMQIGRDGDGERQRRTDTHRKRQTLTESPNLDGVTSSERVGGLLHGLGPRAVKKSV